jgi:uncharacterized protein with HEPN domain
LRDILENIRLAGSFVSGFSLSDFLADRRTSYAVVRCLEIISEASRRLPFDLKERHSEIAERYRQRRQRLSSPIPRRRDELVWQTVHRDLEPLRLVIEQELAKLAQ